MDQKPMTHLGKTDWVFVEFVVSTVKSAADWTAAKARRLPPEDPNRARLNAATFKLGEAVGLIVSAMRDESEKGGAGPLPY